MCSQTHPHGDRKDWEMVIHMDPELFSSDCKIRGNLGTSFESAFPFYVRVQLRSEQAANLPGQSSPVSFYPSAFPGEATLISKAMMVCSVTAMTFFNRKFSASTFLVLEAFS